MGTGQFAILPKQNVRTPEPKIRDNFIISRQQKNTVTGRRGMFVVYYVYYKAYDSTNDGIVYRNSGAVAYFHRSSDFCMQKWSPSECVWIVPGTVSPADD